MTAINLAEMFRAEKRKERERRRLKRLAVHQYQLPGLTGDLDPFVVAGMDGIWYIPEFLSSADEECLCGFVILLGLETNSI